ncbi:MAG: aromatic ring-hydroxylating dioxygenase subunit alpha [Pseudomonadota bacterium]
MPDSRAEIPNDWNRSGLPGWAYFSNELYELERDLLFRTHWQLVCHVSEVAVPGQYVSHDIADERGFVIRGLDGKLRAFHNLCRHRGSRVVGDTRGTCNKVLVCPFHGWAYNLDGSLRGIAHRDSFPPMDHEQMGLKPLEMEIWHGFVFIRYQPGPQPAVAEIMARHEAEIAPYGCADMQTVGQMNWAEKTPVNWKSVRDVDNEGYHVRQAHPGLHDLYGQNYHDEPYVNFTSRSLGKFNRGPSRLLSVRAYRELLPKAEHLPETHQQAWLYIGLFPNLVFGFYPDSVIWYQEIPHGAGATVQKGGVLRYADESREMRIARYLSGRIDRDTAEEDRMLTIWACEATKSSAYEGITLSDLEYGLASFYNHLEVVTPIVRQESQPAPGTMKAANADLLEARV